MAADAHKLLSHLSHDTAQSVLAWLNSRGKDLPVHIPLSTIRFARECFSIIDADNNGTLEAEELLAVFKALGQPASLRQVTRLVESVAGAGAQSLRFSDFAQMMHGAMAERRPGEVNLHSLLQQEVNLGGSGRGDGGGGEEQEAPLNWSDFHLLAKAFRRRVVLDGVINCTEGWREKVAALAERRAASSHAGAVTAASVWRHRVQRLAQAQPASGQGAGTAQGPDAGAEAAAGMLPSTGGGDGGDALCGAISAGPTPRSACGSDIRVDAEEEGRGQDRHALGNSRHQAPDQQAPGISRRQAPGPAGSYGDIFDVYLSGVAAGTPGGAAAAGSPPATPAAGALAATAGDSAEAAAVVRAAPAVGPAPVPSNAMPAGASVSSHAAAFNWRRGASRMRLAGAASRQAAGGRKPGGAPPPPTEASQAGDRRMQCGQQPAFFTISPSSSLLQQTACSRGRPPGEAAAGRTVSSASSAWSGSRQQEGRASRSAAQVQAARLAALALVKQQPIG